MTTRQRDTMQRRLAQRRRRRVSEPESLVEPQQLSPETGAMLQEASLSHPTADGLRQGAVQRLQSGWGNAAVQRFLAELGAVSGHPALAQREDGNPVAPADPGTTTHPTVRYGSQGPAVEELHRFD